MIQDLTPTGPVPDLPMLTLTPEAVMSILMEATELLTGYGKGRVILETKADRRPGDGKPYCTLWFKNLERLKETEGDWYFDPNDSSLDATQVLRNESLCIVQYSFWGPGAYGDAVRFEQTLYHQRRFQDLWRFLGFAGTTSIQDISGEYGAKIQQKAYFELNFYAFLGRAFPADWFDVSAWKIILPKHNHEEMEILPYPKENCDDFPYRMP